MTPVTDLFQKLSHDNLFGKLNLSKGYWQIQVVEEDVHKTAFVAPDRVHVYKMPFGMVNS